MKLDNNNKDTEKGVNMNTSILSSNSNNNISNQQQIQQKRDKSIDIRDTKERLKQEKLQKEKEKKEREKLEKLHKEREKKLEKEKKEREKLLKKSGQLNANNQGVSVSATSSDLNKFSKQIQLETTNSSSSNNLNNTNNSNSGLSGSKSENVLNKLKKQGNFLSSSKKQSSTQQFSSQQMQYQQQSAPKGRLRCQVVYLDEGVKSFDLDKNAIGEDLMTMVCADLELVEKEYFSLTYRDVNNMKFWLDHEKKIKSQLKGNVSSPEPVFNFEIKFYPPEPNVLQEEITRYLLTLQLRHDIMDGKLPCTFVTHALLGSYTVQAELGDFDEINSNNRVNLSGLGGLEYLGGFCFAPNQTTELLAAIAECHKDHKGQSPAEAEMHYLENAVKLAMYGVDLHNAKDSDSVDILIGVSASGLLVFRDHLRINRFAWPKILKISYKRNHFYLKLRPGEFEKYETTIGFRCPNHKSAKRLWKIAVEHHAFFRLREPEAKKNTLLPTFNSKFRYTGTSTYMQSRHRSIERNQPPFTRSLSKRLTQSMDRGLALQNPNETPGSVQSAAFNHFNRMKPHMSVSHIPRQKIDLRESQEDLDFEQGADYNVTDEPNINIQIQPDENFNNVVNNVNGNNQYEITTPKRVPGLNHNQNNYVGNNTIGALPRLNANFLERITRESGNLSNRSSNDSYKQTGGQNYNSNGASSSGVFKKHNFEQNQQSELNSVDQIEDYYTSVDKNFANDENRTPSIKRSVADSIASMSGSNKISTPILNTNQNSQQQTQRYVPSRLLNQQQQNQAQTDQTDSFNIPTSKIPISPKSTLNNGQNQPNSYRQNSTIANLIGSQNMKQSQQQQQDSEPVPFIKSQVYKPGQPHENRSPNNSERVLNPQATSSSGSIRSIDQQQQQQRQQMPQPTVRGRQAPPPVPADRSSINNRAAAQNDSLRYQQQSELVDEQEVENQRYLIEQREAELQQQYQIQNQKIQQLRELQMLKLQQQQASSSIRQGATSSTTNSYVNTFRASETSGSGSITSTPEITRVKKQIVVNEQVNHKDLLLKAIQMATELDPNLEVEKVEITTED